MARVRSTESRVPRGLRVARLRTDSSELVVVSHALPDTQVDLTVSLSEAEREVLSLLLAGFSNAAIAHARGTAFGTVCKQIEAVYRKLGVSSRGELSALAQRVGRAVTSASRSQNQH